VYARVNNVSLNEQKLKLIFRFNRFQNRISHARISHYHIHTYIHTHTHVYIYIYIYIYIYTHTYT